MKSPWLREVLGGVFVLRGFAERTESIVRRANASYHGDDFGGIDYMPPNVDGEAWVLLGNWANCLHVQPAITAYRDALAAAVELDRAGVSFGSGNAMLETARAFPDSPRGELRPWRAYDGGLAIKWWEKPELRSRLEAIFPQLPHYIGLHMGAHHWLGRGIAPGPTGIGSVTPYVRIDFDEGKGIYLGGLADPADFEPWLAQLLAATGWP